MTGKPLVHFNGDEQRAIEVWHKNLSEKKFAFRTNLNNFKELSQSVCCLHQVYILKENILSLLAWKYFQLTSYLDGPNEIVKMAKMFFRLKGRARSFYFTSAVIEW